MPTSEILGYALSALGGGTGIKAIEAILSWRKARREDRVADAGAAKVEAEADVLRMQERRNEIEFLFESYKGRIEALEREASDRITRYNQLQADHLALGAANAKILQEYATAQVQLATLRTENEHLRSKITTLEERQAMQEAQLREALDALREHRLLNRERASTPLHTSPTELPDT